MGKALSSQNFDLIISIEYFHISSRSFCNIEGSRDVLQHMMHWQIIRSVPYCVVVLTKIYALN